MWAFCRTCWFGGHQSDERDPPLRLTLPKIASLAATAIVASSSVATATDDHYRRAPFTYAVLGDTPYGQPQIDNFANDVAEINATDPRMVIHLGDIKNGSTRCDTTYFEQIRSNFDEFTSPLVYTPGDNEWTDCHRTNNGGYTPTERLTALRDIFFDLPGRTLGDRSATLDVQRAPYVENVRWSDRGVVFATINVSGSNNDWVPWFGVTTRTQTQVDEYAKRNAASLKWLDHAFAVAKARKAPAIVIAIQADMFDAAFTGTADDPTQYDHFRDFVQALAKQSLAFGRPVLLLNGDSHVYTDDRPLADSARPYLRTIYGVTTPVPNLRRITTNGSTTLCHEWLKLNVNPSSSSVFSTTRVLFTKQPGFTATQCPAPAYSPRV